MKKLIAGACIAAALVLPAAPAAANETTIVKITACPPGYTGHVVWAWNEKRGWYEIASFCIPWGP